MPEDKGDGDKREQMRSEDNTTAANAAMQKGVRPCSDAVATSTSIKTKNMANAMVGHYAYVVIVVYTEVEGGTRQQDEQHQPAEPAVTSAVMRR